MNVALKLYLLIVCVYVCVYVFNYEWMNEVSKIFLLHNVQCMGTNKLCQLNIQST